VDSSLAGLITHCEPNIINAAPKRQRPDVIWRKQVVRREKNCYAILRRDDTRSELINELGSFG